jgi:two-component system chemotaxis sensor kinase CheA
MRIQYSIFDTLLEPVFVLNAEQKVVYCNETASVVCGVSIRKITRGMKFSELLEFSEPLESLNDLVSVCDPTPYKEVNFKTSQGGEGKVQITLQPCFDQMGDKNWIVFVRDVTLEERLQKKYRAELEQKEDVIKDLEDAKVQLENYSKNLEIMVAERTKELSQLNSTMRALLDSLHQGFFIFNADGKILEVSSKACTDTIECRPEGRNIWDVLKVPENKVDGFKKWMMTVFMEMLPFEDLSPLGPTTYNHTAGKNISLEYFPLRSQEGALEGVVVVASDITSLIVAQKQAEIEREHAKLIINLVQSKKEIGRFVREAQSMFTDLAREFSSSTTDLEATFRALHTLKGGAALFSIQEMAQACHEAENRLSQYKETHSRTDFSALKFQYSKVQKSFDTFLAQTKSILGSAAFSEERQLEVPFSKLQQTMDRVRKLPGGSMMAETILAEFLMEPIGEFFAPYNDVAHKTAEKLEKALSPVQLENTGIPVLPEIYSSLFGTFVHAFRNAVDHGIETPQDRVNAGKPEAGMIKVRFDLIKESGHSKLQICVQDDGAGVDPEKIRARLLSKNIDTSKESDTQVIQHLFDSQFSTKEQITETSGRGVGMDAIKIAAEELDGRAWVESVKGQGTSLFVEVPYYTTLPETKKYGTAA